MVTVEGEESAGAQLGLRCPSKEVSGTPECHGKAFSPRGQLGQEYSSAVGIISEQLALLRVSSLDQRSGWEVRGAWIKRLRGTWGYTERIVPQKQFTREQCVHKRGK